MIKFKFEGSPSSGTLILLLTLIAVLHNATGAAIDNKTVYLHSPLDREGYLHHFETNKCLVARVWSDKTEWFTAMPRRGDEIENAALRLVDCHKADVWKLDQERVDTRHELMQLGHLRNVNYDLFVHVEGVIMTSDKQNGRFYGNRLVVTNSEWHDPNHVFNFRMMDPTQEFPTLFHEPAPNEMLNQLGPNAGAFDGGMLCVGPTIPDFEPEASKNRPTIMVIRDDLYNRSNQIRLVPVDKWHMEQAALEENAELDRLELLEAQKPNATGEEQENPSKNKSKKKSQKEPMRHKTVGETGLPKKEADKSREEHMMEVLEQMKDKLSVDEVERIASIYREREERERRAIEKMEEEKAKEQSKKPHKEFKATFKPTQIPTKDAANPAKEAEKPAKDTEIKTNPTKSTEPESIKADKPAEAIIVGDQVAVNSGNSNQAFSATLPIVPEADKDSEAKAKPEQLTPTEASIAKSATNKEIDPARKKTAKSKKAPQKDTHDEL